MASPNTGVITQTLGSVAGYASSGKYVDSYPPATAGFTKTELWTSPASGTKFTYATFLRIPDQEDLHGYRNLLLGANTNLFFAARNWYNYTNGGSNTNRFYVQAQVSGSGYGGFTKAEDVHGIDSGEWFALMFSIDYSASGVPPTVECWIQKKGESTAYDIKPTGGDLFYNVNGPKNLQFDDATSEVVLLHGHSNPSYDDYYIAADVSEVFVTDEYVDWSSSTERLKYVDSAGEPVGLGSDGSALTGTAAKIYIPDGDATNNLGTAGNFTQVGTVPDSSTSPSSGGGGYTTSLSVAGTAEYAPGTSSGIVTQTLPFITQRATNAYQAVGTQTLPAVTQAGTATYEPGTSTGLATQSLFAVTQAMTADFFAGTSKGPLAQTLWPITQAGTGTYGPGISTGGIVQPINGIVQAISGTFQRAHFGLITQSVPAPVQAGTATFAPGISTGSAAQSLWTISQTLSGHYEVGSSTGWITLQTLWPVNQALTGVVYVKGSIAQTLPLTTQTLTGNFAPDTSTGTLNQVLQGVNQVLIGSRWRIGTISTAINPITQSLAGNFMAGSSTGSISNVLSNVAQSATAHYEPGTSTGNISQGLPFISQSLKAVTFIIIRPSDRLVWEQPNEELIWEVESDELIWER